MGLVCLLLLLTALTGFAIPEEVSTHHDPRPSDGSSEHGRYSSYLNEPIESHNTRNRRAANVPKNYRKKQWEGFYNGSVWWLIEKATNTRKCMATFISAGVAITACECVIKFDKVKYKVSYSSHEGWFQYLVGQNGKHGVTNSNGEELVVRPPEDFQLESFTNRTLRINVTAIDIHEGCRSFFKYNIAMIQTIGLNKEQYKSAWVHTPEDIIFRNNLRRIEAGQTLLGHCKVPWTDISRIDLPLDKGETFGDRDISARVYFQHWSACRSLFCKDYTRKYRNFADYAAEYERAKKKVTCVKEICDEHVANTKWCVFVEDALGGRKPGECLPAGAPIFCYADRVAGIVGFLVQETFYCPPSIAGLTTLAIFQPLDISIAWIKRYLGVSLDPEYPSLDKVNQPGNDFPKWIWGLKKLSPQQVSEATTEKKKYLGKSPEVEDVLEVFANDQSEAIVKVVTTGLRGDCYGVQIAPKKFAVPCFCVYKFADATQANTYKYLHWGELGELVGRTAATLKARAPSEVSITLAARDIYGGATVGSCINIASEADYNKPGGQGPVWIGEGKLRGDPLCYTAKQILKSTKCDGGLAADFALVETLMPVKDAKTVWLHTSNVDYIQKAWTVLPEASLIGEPCFYLNLEYEHFKSEGIYPATTIKVHRFPFAFAPFEVCTPLLCDPDENLIKREHQEFCFNQIVEVRPEIPKFDPYNATRTRSQKQSRDCIRTPKSASCDIVHGTPVFCDLGELRGLVGFVNQASMPGCTQTDENSKQKLPRDSMDKLDGNHSAIIMRIDGFLQEFKEETLIFKMENSAEFQLRSGCFQPKTPHQVLLVLFAASLIF